MRDEGSAFNPHPPSPIPHPSSLSQFAQHCRKPHGISPKRLEEFLVRSLDEMDELTREAATGGGWAQRVGARVARVVGAPHELFSFERAEHLLEAIGHGRPDVLITDVRMPGMSGIALLDRLRDRCPDLPIIVITAHSDLENAVAAYKGGAFEYLPKPFDVDEAMDLVRKAARTGCGARERGAGDDGHDIPSLIGASAALAISGIPFAGPIGPLAPKAGPPGRDDPGGPLRPGVEGLWRRRARRRRSW